MSSPRSDKKKISLLTALLLLGFFGAFGASAWSGPPGVPTTCPPGSAGCDAPINVGSTAQTKTGPLVLQPGSGTGLNVVGAGSAWAVTATGAYGVYANVTSGEAIRGNQSGSGWGGYFTGRYGVYGGANGGLGVYGYNADGYAVYGVSANNWGGYFEGPYGVYGQSGAGEAVRGYSGAGYGGYFLGQGGVFAQNHSGYYGYLGYPGTSWSFYGNGNTYTGGYSRADGGFCIGGSCITSFGGIAPYKWGGMFGYRQGSCQYGNALIGGCTCPSWAPYSYPAASIGAGENVVIYYCYG